MIKKIFLTFSIVIVALTVFFMPVSANAAIESKRPPNPHRPHSWDLDITVYEPYIFDPVNFPDDYLWSFSFNVTMPPVSWPVQVVVLREGVLMPDHTFTIYYEDTDLGFAGPVWEINPPESITYTFVLTARGMSITEDVIVYFD
jgi:hypothetical protein